MEAGRLQRVRDSIHPGPLQQLRTVAWECLPPSAVPGLTREALEEAVLDAMARSCAAEVAQKHSPTLRAVAWCCSMAGLLGAFFVLFSLGWYILINLALACVSVVLISVPLWLARKPYNDVQESRKRLALSVGKYPRCLACDYDVRGTPGDHCPECGAALLLVDTRFE